MSERHDVFANGTQYLDWTARNCDRCPLAGDPSEPGSSACDIFEAIHDAAADDGTVSTDIARRMGLLDNEMAYTWACPEFGEVVEPGADVLMRRLGMPELPLFEDVQV